MRTLNELMDMTGRVAVITGGAGFIGRAASQALAELRASIAVVDVAGSACELVAKSLADDYGVKAIGVVADLAEESATRNIPRQVLDNLGSIDVLMNAASLVGTAKQLAGWSVPFRDQRADTWRLALDVNLTAPFVLTQACSDALAASGHGSVINVASIYGVVGPDMRLYDDTSMGNPAAYAASKGGLLQMTRWLASVLAPNVRVNAISPGGVLRDQPAAFEQRYNERTPLGRMAVEEDLKGAVAYLASDLSGYVTGHNLVVDGGWTTW